MKRVPIPFLQTVIVLIGIGALAALLLEPRLEGRNALATNAQIYFHDPFLAYAYVASLPFFAALVQAFRVLGYVEKDEVFSRAAVKSVQAIKYCLMAVVGFVAIGELFIMLGTSDDRAGGVFMGLLIAVGSVVAASTAAVFERILQSAVEMKSKTAER